MWPEESTPLATKKKVTSGNPAKRAEQLELKASQHPLAKRLFNRIKEGTQLVAAFQDHIIPMGDQALTLEQWRYLRGSVAVDLALYAQITGQPSPIDIIIKAEQERVLIEQNPPL
jgi:hypothetical protein